MQIYNLCAEERTKIILQKGSVTSCLLPFPPQKETSASLNPSLPADTLGSLHVDGVCMLLAQGFVLLGVEWLPLQVHVADLGQRTDRHETAHEAGGHKQKISATPLRQSAVTGRWEKRQQPASPYHKCLTAKAV